MGEQSVNIIYITNNCDIDCSYCYQREERQNSKKFIIDDSKIIESINNIKKNISKNICKTQNLKLKPRPSH